jgi:hypothetical protein
VGWEGGTLLVVSSDSLVLLGRIRDCFKSEQTIALSPDSVLGVCCKMHAIESSRRGDHSRKFQALHLMQVNVIIPPSGWSRARGRSS